jgi:hypothetical protein
VSTEQYVKGEEVQEQAYKAKHRHNEEYAGSLKSRRFNFGALGRGAQLLAAAFAIVRLLRVLETARGTKHTFLRRKFGMFPAFTLWTGR